MTTNNSLQLKLLGFFFLGLTVFPLLSLAMIGPVFHDVLKNPPEAMKTPETDRDDPGRQARLEEMKMSMLVGMLIFGIVEILICLQTGILILRRKNQRSCIIGAAVCCLVFPFGTLLGIWAIIVLSSKKSTALFSSS
jgi:hypothetical protein